MNKPRPYRNWRSERERRWRDAFHTFGHLLMTHARDDSLRKIPASVSEKCYEVAAKAVVDALYNVLMILEGVVGAPMGKDHRMEFALIARVREADGSYRVVEEFELAPNGAESACMGFHYWTEGDFRR